MGGALCRPLRRHRCRDQSRKPWRERPRCARSKWPRACPEGSLTPWLSVSVSVAVIALPVSARKRRESGRRCARGIGRQIRPDDLVPFVREILVHELALVPRAMTRLIRRPRCRDRCPLLGARSESTSCTSSDAPAITRSMLDLCSAPCKARRFAPPAHARGLRALTVPARRSRLGHYVMVGSADDA